MAKKLKKKIEELCGLKELAWEDRQAKAKSILANLEWKQQLCNDIQGLCFRDLERALNSIANERQTKDDDEKIVKHPKSTNRPPARSLQEILAQVYAPRVLPQEERGIYHYQVESDPKEILSDFVDDDYEAE